MLNFLTTRKELFFDQNWKSKTWYFCFKAINYFLPKSINGSILHIIFWKSFFKQCSFIVEGSSRLCTNWSTNSFQNFRKFYYILTCIFLNTELLEEKERGTETEKERKKEKRKRRKQENRNRPITLEFKNISNI